MGRAGAPHSCRRGSRSPRPKPTKVDHRALPSPRRPDADNPSLQPEPRSTCQSQGRLRCAGRKQATTHEYKGCPAARVSDRVGRSARDDVGRLLTVAAILPTSLAESVRPAGVRNAPARRSAQDHRYNRRVADGPEAILRRVTRIPRTDRGATLKSCRGQADSPSSRGSIARS